MSKPAKKPLRRHFQFSLRTLLALVTLAAGLAVAWRWYVEPYRQQRQVMELVKELGGSMAPTSLSTAGRDSINCETGGSSQNQKSE